ncbi:MAG: ArnT family glycosyltransferase [Anaerolineae bacterium]
MKFFKTGKTTAVSNVTWGLILIALLAIAVRLWGLNYDLPYIYHPDEPGYIVRSQSIFKTGDLNPHFFNYPSFMFYLNALAYVPYYAAGKLAGVFGAPSDILPPTSLAMGVTYAPMPTAVLLNRLVTLVFGVGVVLVTFGAGRRLTGSTAVALLASLFVALSPTNVFNSRQVTPDTFVTFWVIVGFYGAILIYKQGETRHYLLAGIGVGLAAASKYNGGLIILAVVAAHLLRHGKASLKQPRIYFALLTSGLAFLIA